MNQTVRVTPRNIIEQTVYLMEQAQRMLDKTGLERKHIVMQEVKSILGEESYERYRDLLDIFIDFTKAVSRGKFRIDLGRLKTECVLYRNKVQKKFIFSVI
jgi:hypothetical protein